MSEQEARARYETMLARGNDTQYALVGLGDIERREHHYECAIKHYTRVLSENPENKFALFGLAESYRALRRYPDAIEVWERYIKYDPENVTVLTRVADSYRKVGTFARSRELYLAVLEIEHDNPYALIGLGHLCYDFHDYETAKYYWERMYEISGPKPDIRILTSLGNCHRKLKTYELGVPYFFEALSVEPNNFYALYGLADCYRGMRLTDRSLEYWNRILENDPRNKVILTRAGDACRALGDLDQAETYYHRALDIDFDLFAMIGLAILHRKRGRYQDAITTLQELAAANPENTRIVLELVSCYETRRDPHAALGVLERHIRSVRNPSPTVMKRLQEVKRALDAPSGRH